MGVKQVVMYVMVYCGMSVAVLHAEIVDVAGNIRNLATSPIIFGTDSSQTTSVKNAILTNVSNDNRLIGANSQTKLVLQNATLSLDETYSFTQGELVIVGDVSILGPGKTFNLNNVATTIASGATLEVGPSVIFEYSPSGSGKGALLLQDATSGIVLDSCRLRVATPVGMALRRGGLTVRGTVTVDATVTETRGGLFIGAGMLSKSELAAGIYNDGDCRLRVDRGGRLVANLGSIVLRNRSCGSTDLTGDLVVGSDKSFSLSGSYDFDGRAAAFDIPYFTGIHFFSVPGSLTTLSGANKDHGAIVESVAWTPDNRFLAAGGESGTGGFEVRVYSFDGASLTELSGCNKDFGSSVFRLKWSPNGKFLGVVGGASPEVRVYEFDEANLTELSGSNKNHGTFALGVDWSPSGKFLAIVGGSGTGNFDVRVYRFDGFSLTELSGSNKDHGATARAVAWSPDGNFLAIGGDAGTGGAEVRLYSFDGSSLTEVSSNNHPSDALEVVWSPDGKHLAVGGGTQVTIFEVGGVGTLTSKASGSFANGVDGISWSPDGVYLAVGSTTGGLLRVARFEGESLSELSGVTGSHGSSFREVDWSPDEVHIAIGGVSGTGGADVRVFRVSNKSKRDVVLQNGGVTFRSAVELDTIDMRLG